MHYCDLPGWSSKTDKAQLQPVNQRVAE